METKTKVKATQTQAKHLHISGAEAVVRCLLAEGADLIYGYPGGAIMPVYDELYKFQDQLHHVAPGPEVAIATPTFPEVRANPCAA